MAVSLVVTNQAAGGLVRPRTMLDFALQRTQPGGGIHIVNTTIPDSFPEFGIGPEPGSDGRVRAKTHAGSGCAIEPVPGRSGVLLFTMVSTLDLNGWLSPGVVDAAMSASLAQSTRQMQDHVRREMAERRGP